MGKQKKQWPEVEDPLVIFTGPSPRGWHRLQQAAECLQRYAWSYECGPKKDISKKKPLAIGTLWHLALAQHYSRMQMQQEGKNPNEYMDPEEAVRLVASVSGIEKHVDSVFPAFGEYKRKHFGDIRNMRIFAVETLFDGTIDPGPMMKKLGAKSYRLTGRVDLMYEDLGGTLWCMDHKTTGRLTSRHKAFYAISGQLLGYQHLARQKHPELGGMKVNLIQHAGFKSERITLPRSPLLERQFQDRAIDIEMQIEHTKGQNRPVDAWPKAMTELACYHRYGACDHLDQCRFGQGALPGGNWKWEG